MSEKNDENLLIKQDKEVKKNLEKPLKEDNSSKNTEISPKSSKKNM